MKKPAVLRGGTSPGVTTIRQMVRQHSVPSTTVEDPVNRETKAQNRVSSMRLAVVVAIVQIQNPTLRKALVVELVGVGVGRIDKTREVDAQ